MKRLVGIILMVALFVTGAGAETVTVFCTPGQEVNLRAEPSRHSECVGRYTCGDTFETDGKIRRDSQGRKWVHMVNTALEVNEAWIMANYVQGAVEIRQMFAQVDARGRVAVRNAPNGERVKWIKNGTEIEVYACSEEWACTEEGYISIDCLMFEGGEG